MSADVSGGGDDTPVTYQLDNGYEAPLATDTELAGAIRKIASDVGTNEQARGTGALRSLTSYVHTDGAGEEISQIEVNAHRGAGWQASVFATKNSATFARERSEAKQPQVDVEGATAWIGVANEQELTGSLCSDRTGVCVWVGYVAGPDGRLPRWDELQRSASALATDPRVVKEAASR